MPVKNKQVEMTVAYNPVFTIDVSHIARQHGLSLDHPVVLTLKGGQIFIKGVQRENKTVSKKAGNASPARMGQAVKEETNET